MTWVAYLIWLPIPLYFGVFEAIGLRRKHGAWVPLTTVVRRLMGRRSNPEWWLFFGLWAWLGVHFFVNGVRP